MRLTTRLRTCTLGLLTSLCLLQVSCQKEEQPLQEEQNTMRITINGKPYDFDLVQFGHFPCPDPHCLDVSFRFTRKEGDMEMFIDLYNARDTSTLGEYVLRSWPILPEAYRQVAACMIKTNGNSDLPNFYGDKAEPGFTFRFTKFTPLRVAGSFEGVINGVIPVNYINVAKRLAVKGSFDHWFAKL